MPINLSDSNIYSKLFGDDDLAPIFSEKSEIDSLIEVERSLAKVEGNLALIPKEYAEQIVQSLSNASILSEDLADGTKSAGIPVPALVAKLREFVGGDAGGYIHFGATSQDIMDTGLILRLKSVCSIIDTRLKKLIEELSNQSLRYKDTVVPARTRSQQAVPTVLGLKIASWIPPLKRYRQRLTELLPRLLIVQFGGAVGTLAPFQGRGIEVMEGLAQELELNIPDMPWHTQREGVAEYSSLLTMVSATLGKLGQDLILLGQNEIRELFAGTGGGSSTMPQKSNPVLSESLVAIARHVSNLNNSIMNSVIHSQERDGVAWTIELFALPSLTVLTGTALNNAIELVSDLQSDQDRIDSTLENSNGLIMAEAVAFELAKSMQLPKAQKIVKDACAQIVGSSENLIDYLERTTNLKVDWGELRDNSNYLGNAEELIIRAIGKQD